MVLYAVCDKKSLHREYFLASCDEDAVRIWLVMASSSRPMLEFLDEFNLTKVLMLSDVSVPSDKNDVVMTGEELRRQIDFRKERLQNAKN